LDPPRSKPLEQPSGFASYFLKYSFFCPLESYFGPSKRTNRTTFWFCQSRPNPTIFSYCWLFWDFNFVEHLASANRHICLIRMKIRLIPRSGLQESESVELDPHWIGSHPDLKPCEVFGHNENPPIAYGRKIKIHEFKSPNLQKIQDTMTTNASEAFWVHRGQKQYVYHPWYAKDGRLYEYKNLYSKVPQNDSWFYTLWSRFPTPDDWLVNNKE
jgi:hypothetical protein